MNTERLKRFMVFAILLVLLPCAELLASGAKETSPAGGQTATTSGSKDDMSKKVEFSMTVTGWVNQPFPDDDPIRAYIEDKFNCGISYTTYTQDDFNSKLASQLATGTGPDFIGSWDRLPILRWWEQGLLVDDHTPYLKYVPSLTQRLTETDRLYTTSQKKLYGLPKHSAAPEYYYIQIRQDWLKRLGLKQPMTDEELVQVAQAFTFSDPDGNGAADTWGFGCVGLSSDDVRNNWGGLDVYQAMYGNPGWYVTDKGELTNPTLSGTRRKFLQFLKRVVDTKLMDPDFVQNPNFHEKAVGGRIGIFAYHNDITVEAEGILGKEDLAGTWAFLKSPLKAADGSSGGMRKPTADVPSMIFAFTKKGAQDEAKVRRILDILDWWQWPSEGCYVTWFGYRVYPHVTAVQTKDFLYVGGSQSKDDPRNKEAKYATLWDWGVPGSCYVGMRWGAAPEPNKTQYYEFDEQRIVEAMPRYPGDLQNLCILDPKLTTALDDFVGPAEAEFITGKRDFGAWDQYVQEWKSAGGQQMAAEMTAQLKALGVMK